MINRDPMTLDQAIARYGPGVLDHLQLVKDLAPGSGVRIVPPSVKDGLYAISPQTDPAMVLPIAAYGQPAAFLAAAYQTIVTYACPVGGKAKIFEISYTSNKPATTDWRISIRGKAVIDGVKTLAAPAFQWPNGLDLNAVDIVLIEAKSDGAVSVTCNGMITGQQEG